jgi:poly-gamma-glutamate synthesis protein (capsule biosynthesis protein)
VRTKGLLAALVALAGDAHAAPVDEASAPRGCVTLFGDVTLARGVGKEIRRRAESPWAGVADAAPLAGAWIANLEGALLPDGGAACPRRDGLCLGIDASDLRWLTGGRFAAFSLANNHAGDFGPAGAQRLARELSARNLAPLVAESGPTFVDAEGIRWGFVGLNLVADRPGQAREMLERARLQVGLARAQTGHVVVLPHWGREGQADPTPQQEEAATLLASWGATVIAGSHAHVVQPHRCQPDAAVYFGLGNLLFDQSGEPYRTGQAVTCCPRGDGVACAAATTERPPRSVFPAIRPDAAPDAACVVDAAPPDTRWLAHPDRGALLFVQAFPTAGKATFFALRRHYSDFDREDALRPYVFRIDDSRGAPRVVDVWRGTSLARPLVAARLFDWRGRQLLCAIHRGDSFLHPDPATRARLRIVYRWTGFGFAGVNDEEARNACERF